MGTMTMIFCHTSTLFEKLFSHSDNTLSDKDRQRKFVQLFGMLDDSVAIPDDLRAISEDQASLLADAANHVHTPAYASKNCDVFFTIKEVKRAGMLLSRRESITTCGCRAHRLIMDPSTCS